MTSLWGILEDLDEKLTAINNAVEDGNWVTINGARILIHDGETIGDAFKRTTGNDLSGSNKVKFKISPKGESAHDNEVYRANIKESSKWAAYDKEGNRIAQGKGSFVEPSSDELAILDSHAKFIASRTKSKGIENPQSDQYIRFGRPSPTGKSINFQTGEQEQGVSAFKGQYNPETGLYEFAPGSGTGGSLMGLARGGSKSGPKTPYLASGTEIGTGSDGEPVLKDVILTHTLIPSGNGFKRVPLKITPSKKYKGVK
jgi:hypothetical protein